MLALRRNLAHLPVPPTCCHSAGPPGEILVDHKRSNIQINRKDMGCMAHLQVRGHSAHKPHPWDTWLCTLCAISVW